MEPQRFYVRAGGSVPLMCPGGVNTYIALHKLSNSIAIKKSMNVLVLLTRLFLFCAPLEGEGAPRTQGAIAQVPRVAEMALREPPKDPKAVRLAATTQVAVDTTGHACRAGGEVV